LQLLKDRGYWRWLNTVRLHNLVAEIHSPGLTTSHSFVPANAANSSVVGVLNARQPIVEMNDKSQGYRVQYYARKFTAKALSLNCGVVALRKQTGNKASACASSPEHRHLFSRALIVFCYQFKPLLFLLVLYSSIYSITDSLAIMLPHFRHLLTTFNLAVIHLTHAISDSNFNPNNSPIQANLGPPPKSGAAPTCRPEPTRRLFTAAAFNSPWAPGTPGSISGAVMRAEGGSFWLDSQNPLPDTSCVHSSKQGGCPPGNETVLWVDHNGQAWLVSLALASSF
jgi:hypothetical protein